MKFTVAIATIAAFAGFFTQVIAAPTTEAAAEALADIPLEKRGFGCNGPWDENDEQCHKHCASISGYKGGYCDMGGFRCKCY